MNRFELIVFDWDGTLMDSAATIVGAIQAACKDLDIEPPTDARARHIIGLGLNDALMSALPDLHPSRYPVLAERYRHHYLAGDRDLTMFAGIDPLLSGLTQSGHLLAVATGKSRKGLDRVLAATGVGVYFKATRCVDECPSKPHPQMLRELMAEVFVPPERTLMIGDTTHDLKMAQNAGVAALAVAYGAHPRAELVAEQPLYCAGSVAELQAWLTRHA